MHTHRIAEHSTAYSTYSPHSTVKERNEKKRKREKELRFVQEISLTTGTLVLVRFIYSQSFDFPFPVKLFLPIHASASASAFSFSVSFHFASVRFGCSFFACAFKSMYVRVHSCVSKNENWHTLVRAFLVPLYTHIGRDRKGYTLFDNQHERVSEPTEKNEK